MDLVLVRSADKPLQGRHVLVVEDEMLILMETEDMLADLGCASVVAASTVAGALALIEVDTFDAALLDLNLDGDRSYAIADALDEKGVPFAYATGYGKQGLRKVDGSRPMLMKPYSTADLAETLRVLCLN